MMTKALAVAVALLLQDAGAVSCTPAGVDPADYAYPDVLPTVPGVPAALEIFGAINAARAPKGKLRETPIAIRTFSLINSALWNCVAAYNAGGNDAFDHARRPIISSIPPELGGVSLYDTPPRAVCMVHSTAAALGVLLPDAVEDARAIFARLGFGEVEFGVRSDVLACAAESDPVQCLDDLARCHNYKPAVVAGALAWQMWQYALADGWNMDGSDGGACQANCRPFADTTGYTPVNHPGSAGRHNAHRWQPLLEDNGMGFFYRQEHVTPHIGKTAKLRVLTEEDKDEKTLPRPHFNYRKEAKLVHERLAGLTEKQKVEIEFFDDKVNLVIALGTGISAKFGWSLERTTLFNAAYTMAEHDAVVISWKEKVRHDRVRPTTVVQQTKRYGTEETVTTYGGPGEGTKTISARFFQPYIRVMPHAEYPSGSGCLCQTITEYTTGFMERVFNDSSKSLPMSATIRAGSSSVEPGITPSEDVTLSFATPEELKLACGQSRLDGGMHFTRSVPDAYELCEGIGSKAVVVVDDLLNGYQI